MSKFQKRHTKIGARPGTLVIPRDAAAPKMRIMDYTAEKLEERDILDPEELRTYRDSPSVTWIDVQGLGDEARLLRMGEVFGLHPLALEDIVNVPQRPNTQEFDDHLLFITRMIKTAGGGNLDMEQVSIFLGRGYVMTFQERHGDVFDAVRARIRRGGGTIRKLGPDYLAYALIDTVIDAYYPVLEEIGDYLEQLEDEVVGNPTRSSLQKIYRAKRELLTLRRSIWPQREAVGALVRDESPFVTDAVRVYLRDTHDHCVQVIDGTETYRELVGGLMDVYLSSIGNRQNEVMKVLTIMASIFVPLTFLAGIYGMNFDNIPELHYRWGYPTLLALMGVVTAGMLTYFWHLGWIGNRSRDDSGAD
jgi:magnesium transporter